jgi:hypothetical protein
MSYRIAGRRFLRVADTRHGISTSFLRGKTGKKVFHGYKRKELKSRQKGAIFWASKDKTSKTQRGAQRAALFNSFDQST